MESNVDRRHPRCTSYSHTPLGCSVYTPFFFSNAGLALSHDGVPGSPCSKLKQSAEENQAGFSQVI